MTNDTRWAVYINDKEVRISGPQLAGPKNALQFGQGVSLDNPATRIRVLEHTRMDDGWDSGIDIGQFRAGEPLERNDWT